MAKEKQDQKKTSYRSKKTQRASRLTSALVKPAIRKRGFLSAEILTRWPLIVGPELCDVVIPIQLRFPRGRGVSDHLGATLEVRTEAAFATMLQHHSQRIIEGVNRYFGYGAVAKLAIKQGPLPKLRKRNAKQLPPISEDDRHKVNDIVGPKGDGDLGKAVAHMMETVLRTKDSKN